MYAQNLKLLRTALNKVMTSEVGVQVDLKSAQEMKEEQVESVKKNKLAAKKREQRRKERMAQGLDPDTPEPVIPEPPVKHFMKDTVTSKTRHQNYIEPIETAATSPKEATIRPMEIPVTKKERAEGLKAKKITQRKAKRMINTHREQNEARLENILSMSAAELDRKQEHMQLVDFIGQSLEHNLNVTQKQFQIAKRGLMAEQIKHKNFDNYTKRKMK